MRPHKIRYYVERDAEFEAKMAQVLHVYKEVEMVNEYRRGQQERPLAVVTCVFRSKWATDSGKKWATDSASNWATDSGGI